ncbi:MAG TPA: hypothetical protein VIY86_03490 [Pirellulaceae bacterium]
MRWLLLVSAMACVSLSLYLTQRLRHLRSQYVLRMRDLFHRRREWLEAEFLTQAGRSGRPRGLQWAECDFEDAVSFARDRKTRQYRALVAVTIRFKAISGGGMEHVAAVHNLRSATAVFHFDQGQWRTDGRAVFNLSPAETIEHFAHELEPVA